jgi:hypothetical protein
VVKLAQVLMIDERLRFEAGRANDPLKGHAVSSRKSPS